MILKEQLNICTMLPTYILKNYQNDTMNISSSKKMAKYNIGDIVIHKQLNYKAIIVDIDPIFQASKQYNHLVNKHPFAYENIWYRLLVDKSCHATYVKESQLTIANNDIIINNPLIDNYFTRKNGHYHPTHKSH